MAYSKALWRYFSRLNEHDYLWRKQTSVVLTRQELQLPALCFVLRPLVFLPLAILRFLLLHIFYLFFPILPFYFFSSSRPPSPTSPHLCDQSFSIQFTFTYLLLLWFSFQLSISFLFCSCLFFVFSCTSPHPASSSVYLDSASLYFSSFAPVFTFFSFRLLCLVLLLKFVVLISSVSSFKTNSVFWPTPSRNSLNNYGIIRSEVLTAANEKTAIFWMWRRAVWYKWTDVSEERATSVFRVEDKKR